MKSHGGGGGGHRLNDVGEAAASVWYASLYVCQCVQLCMPSVFVC